ncbi:MBL fold metallo-hydrolase [Pelagibacterium xiamenense]|uniref:MBL fold metallo-hydrolase n=1 Tax=Pelagibacterium xiamenense TaxID=2901140 RepID=UPI001E5C5A26|nr:MBL fold metallo-hydrolase [Pelagibacterium xiamenense]MCD7060648.1 MBL fold metallo-hydrolase [Pelagibacterium xiamenense]
MDGGDSRFAFASVHKSMKEETLVTKPRMPIPGPKATIRSLGIVAMLTLSSALAAQEAEPAVSNELIVTLLGTGTPGADPSRYGYSNLVQAGEITLLIDAGRGAPVRINQMGLRVGSIDGVFLTHFHSDHINGLGDVFMTGYLTGPIGGREEPMRLIGPRGTVRIAEGLETAYRVDAEIRIDDEGVPEDATFISAHEAQSGVVFDQDGVTVTAFETHHGEAIKPSVGYRIDYAGKSVGFSGDVANDAGIIEHLQGVDLLVHSVATAPTEMLDLPFVKRVLSHHISPQDAGRTFAQTQPNMAVYSHVGRLGDGEVRMTDLVEATRQTYGGPLTVGEDLMQFRIGDDGLAIVSARD